MNVDYNFHDTVPQGARNVTKNAVETVAGLTFPNPFTGAEEDIITSVAISTNTSDGSWDEIVAEAVFDERSLYSSKVRQSEEGEGPARKLYDILEEQGMPTPSSQPDEGVRFVDGMAVAQFTLSKAEYESLSEG